MATTSQAGTEQGPPLVPEGSTVQIHGASASGKSTLALQLARQRLPAALILPEAMHPQRIRQLLDGVTGRVLITRPGTLPHQEEAVSRACRMLEHGQVGCVVLDSLTYLYRFEQLASTDALREILAQLHRLRRAAVEGDGVALFTNQIRGSSGGPRPLGGPAVAHAADVILGLTVMEGSWRRLHLEKHPLQPAGSAWDLRLEEEGLISTPGSGSSPI